MLKQCEGSHAVAEAVALCRPEVICAYPISPQTHIVEGIGEMVKSGELKDCEFINVESEFAAMSVAIGSSAAGARTYTATASQGLLYMVEAVYNASGLGLPIVMTVANRAIGAPINIWNDHSDSLSQRDCGWVQLFAETNQEALDLHIQAFKLAEEISLPVMVCMDGFILTHAYERVDMPTQEQVDAFLPPYEPRQVLDVNEPVSIGAMVGPEAFMEVRYLAHAKQMQALELIPQLAAEFKSVFGRESGGLIRTYRTEDAETIVIAMGSVLGTIKDTVDEMRRRRTQDRRARHHQLPPLPAGRGRRRAEALQALRGAGKEPRRRHRRHRRHQRAHGRHRHGPQGLHRGRRPRRPRHHHEIPDRPVREGRARRARPVTFLDLDWKVVNKQLEREREKRRTGPAAEAMLRDVGAVAARNY
jgi:pyruvate ferredoxin oxidoreductase alpha subunit